AKSSVNQNIDANIYGVEFESVWSPIDRLTFNAQVGFLHTAISGGAVLGQMNPNQGDPNLTGIKSSDGAHSVVNTPGLAAPLHALITRTKAAPPGIQQSALLGSPLPGGPRGICGGATGAGQYGYLPPTFGLAPPAGGFASPANDPFHIYNYSASPNVVTYNGV